MSVKRYTIKIPRSGATATHINLPVNMEFQVVDQAEVIERDFVNIEAEKSINPILDYEKARFSPVNGTSKILGILYDLRFINGGLSSVNNWSDVAMEDDDIKFRKNKWKKSFLSLNFYDTDKGTNQRLISIITLFPNLNKNDIHGFGAVAPDIPSTPKSATNIPLIFRVDDPLTRPDEFAEGYYIYNYKDEVTKDLPLELFMRATFNNAKTGKATNMITTPSIEPIDKLVNFLHTKYILKRDDTGYFYEIDSTQDNVTITGQEIRVKLYEIQVA